VKEFEYLKKKNEKIFDVNNMYKIDINEIQVTVDKGANFLRSSYDGASSQSIIQLEYQTSSMTFKEIKDLSDYVKKVLAS
jgi:hypothetical protein